MSRPSENGSRIAHPHCLGGCGTWVTELAPFCVPCRDELISRYAEGSQEAAAFGHGVAYTRSRGRSTPAALRAMWEAVRGGATPDPVLAAYVFGAEAVA